MIPSIVVVGNVNLETSLQFPGQFPIPYVPVNYVFGGIASRVSGVGFNLAKALQTLGRRETDEPLAAVRFATLVADDQPGKLILQTLKNCGLMSEAVIPQLSNSPLSVVIYDQTGRRQVNTDLKDLGEQVYPPDKFANLLDGCRLAIISNINYARPLLSVARERGVPIACDIQDINSLDNAYNQDFIKSADILFMSHEQLPDSPYAWARQLQSRFHTPIIVVGLGRQGALLMEYASGTAVHVPATTVRPVINTSGAGDALLAAYAFNYSLGQDSVTALEKAVVFAGYKIGDQSSSEGFLDFAALELLHQRHSPTPNVLLDGAPSIPSLTFRFARGPQDAQSLYAIHDGRIEHDRIDPESLTSGLPTLEQFQAALAAVENNPKTNHRLIAEIEGQAVGYTNLDFWQEADGTWVYLGLGWVLPAWRGRGLGTALLHFIEDRIRRKARAEHPGEKAELAANASTTEKDSEALLLAEGYKPAYTVLEMKFDLATPITSVPLPAGLQILPVTPDQYLQIARSVEESYRDEYIDGHYADRFDPQDYILELSGNDQDRTLWKVAWDGDQVAGQVLSRLRKVGAEVFEVSVRPAYRRKGLARALLLQALETLRLRGIEDIRLHTVAEFRTRACDLYTSVGFRTIRLNPRYRKPL